jgi:hypothetical protein
MWQLNTWHQSECHAYGVAYELRYYELMSERPGCIGPSSSWLLQIRWPDRRVQPSRVDARVPEERADRPGASARGRARPRARRRRRPPCPGSPSRRRRSPGWSPSTGAAPPRCRRRGLPSRRG